MKTAAFEEAFDQGQDLSLYLDLSQARRPHPAYKNATATAAAFPQGEHSWVNPAAPEAGKWRQWFLGLLQSKLGPQPQGSAKMARMQTA